MSTAPPLSPSTAGFPANADSTRRAHFREALNTRLAAYSLVVGVAVAVLYGSAQHSPAIILGGGLGVIALVFAVAWLAADRRAEVDFFGALAEETGLQEMPEGGRLFPTTPLLAAGTRRRLEHLLAGPLVGSDEHGRQCLLAHYTYETAHEDPDLGSLAEAVREHRFTLCAIDLPQTTSRFPGVYVRRRQGVAEQANGGDWLAGERVHALEVESAAFTDAYELNVSDDQDEVVARQLLAPSLVVWLAEHPLRPGFELRAGSLVVFCPGHLDDAGRFTWLRDAAARLAESVAREAAPAPGPLSPPVL